MLQHFISPETGCLANFTPLNTAIARKNCAPYGHFTDQFRAPRLDAPLTLSYFSRVPQAQLTRRLTFAAAHRYFRPDWSEAENRRVFGACANPYGHGHNYVLEVTVSGAIDERTGFSVDLGALDELLDREVTRVFDHQHINHAIPDFAEGKLIPTTENILAWLWPRLNAGIPAGATLQHLRLHEDDTFFVDYSG
jgi:6-pyruvoyltetrahydropterin/6-carboxytetrahydropterin synthase